MRKSIKNVSISLLFTSLAAWAAVAAPSLKGGSATGQAGMPVTVPFELNPAGAAISSIQFDLVLPPSIRMKSITGSSILATAGKTVRSYMVGDALRLVVFGINQNPIPAGSMLTAQLMVAPDASGTYSLPITQVLYVDPDGQRVASGAVSDAALKISGVSLVQSGLSGVKAYPNPWRADRHMTPIITFTGLPADAQVKIFTVSGHWVKNLLVGGGTANWDLTNDSDDSVASGIYLYLITSGGDKKTGQLTLIK